MYVETWHAMHAEVMMNEDENLNENNKEHDDGHGNSEKSTCKVSTQKDKKDINIDNEADQNMERWFVVAGRLD